MAEELPGGCRGGDQPPGDDLGRRTAATGDSAPAGGRFHGGCAPHCRRRKVRSAPFPPAAKTAPAPFAPPFPTRPASLGSRGDPNRSCRKENGPHPQGVRRIRKRQSRQRLRSGRSKRKERLAPNLHVRASWLKYGGCPESVPTKPGQSPTATRRTLDN